MESIAEETRHDILLKLPTRDLARCRCVCKPWRRLLSNPSFCRLDDHAVACSGAAERLLVSQGTPRGKTMETTVLCVSSAKPMCSVVDLAEEYRIASVCNGFIVLASGSYKSIGDPVLVCNPVTGETLQVPAPPALNTAGLHLFAMGFSASSHQYKLFRLPFHGSQFLFQKSKKDDNFLDVYTLEGGGGWRRHQDPFRRHGVHMAESPPVLVDGKIYMLTKRNESTNAPNNLLVIDVASEAYRLYPLVLDLENSYAATCMFELGGQPCIAVAVESIDDHTELDLWVMPTPELAQGDQQQLEKKLLGKWIRCYRFDCVNRNPCGGDDVVPMVIWVEGAGILCCIIGDHLYRYDTTKHKNDEDEDDEDEDEEDEWDLMSLKKKNGTRNFSCHGRMVSTNDWLSMGAIGPHFSRLEILLRRSTTMSTSSSNTPGYMLCDAINHPTSARTMAVRDH